MFIFYHLASLSPLKQIKSFLSNILKEDYPEFSKWYNKKKKDNAKAFIQKNNEGMLQAFLYLKQELEDITDA